LFFPHPSRTSLPTRHVLALQLVSRDWNALAMNYLAQAKVSCPPPPKAPSCESNLRYRPQALELTSVARVVKEAVARLLPHIPDLRSLIANKCYKLTTADLATAFRSCPRLQALHLDVRFPSPLERRFRAHSPISCLPLPPLRHDALAGLPHC
jgi:hypothetical protein